MNKKSPVQRGFLHFGGTLRTFFTNLIKKGLILPPNSDYNTDCSKLTYSILCVPFV